MGDIIPIIHNDFYNHAEDVLERYAKATLRLGQELRLTRNIINGVRPDYFKDSSLDFLKSINIQQSDNADLANINDDPIDQTEYVGAHHDLIDAIDDVLVALAYMIKIENFVPKLIQRLGSNYHYSITLSSGKTQHQDVNLIDFLSSEDIKSSIQDFVDSSFVYVHQLRETVTPETLNQVLGDNNIDTFSKKFYQGKFFEANKIGSRIEYLFFEKYEIPLGGFYCDPHIEKWIKRQMLQAGMNNNLYKNMASGKITRKFPAIIGPSAKTGFLLTSNARYSYASGLYGVIPATGIFIGDMQQKPKHSQPRLVH